MDSEYFVPFIGLLLSLSIHLGFYYMSYKRDSTFTGLLKTQEDLLVDSIVILGGIQMTYFFWRLSQTLPGAEVVLLNNLVNTVGFIFLGLFAYISYKLIQTMEKITENYTVNIESGGN